MGEKVTNMNLFRKTGSMEKCVLQDVSSNNFLLVSRVFAVWETELIGLCPCAEKLEAVYVSAAMAATGIYQLSWKIR
jgi:hypothetical protein